MFLIHVRKKDLCNFCHNSRVAAHKTELIASKRPREARSNGNRSSFHFSIFYLHIYALLFPLSFLLDRIFETQHDTNDFRSFSKHSRRAWNEKNTLRALRGFFSSAKLDVLSCSWMQKKWNQSYNEISRKPLKFEERRRFITAKGLRGFHTDLERGERGCICRISPATSEMTVNQLHVKISKGIKKQRRFTGDEANPFPFFRKIYRIREQSERPAWADLFFESMKRKNVSSSLTQIAIKI